MKQKYILHRLLLTCILFFSVFLPASAQWNVNHSIGTSSGLYVYTYNQAPAQFLEFVAAATPATGVTYQWEQSALPLSGFSAISGATASSYTSPVLPQTTYFRRKSSRSPTDFIYSNTIKISVVSVNYENINYIREHDLLKPGVTDWKVIDVLPIGDKLQTTTYLDGLGRPLEKVSRETATPASGTLWGDMVQFSVYDVYGRQPKQYLPYTTTTESGKYKTTPLTTQPQYYTATYSESAAYSNVALYDNSPLHRPLNVKSPGTSWGTSAGDSTFYDLNTLADNVQVFTIGYTSGDIPVRTGIYAANTLFKTKYTDENGKDVIEYSDKSGQVILTKTQIDNVPLAAHTGWICVYSIYDDFGLLRYRLQPEAVKYLDANAWSFGGTNGTQVLNELCFRYEYDEKGRNILKKAPGAKELRMIYDDRDRVVFMQDGNQSIKSPPEWTANLYDELDRPVITTLYRTTKTAAVLQTDINNSVIPSTVTLVNPAAPLASLVVDNRLTTIPRYAAQTSIEFTDGFVSPDGDAFVAEIDATAVQNISVTSAVYKNPIPTADLNNAAVCTVLKYQFYDDYTFAGAKPFDNTFDNTTAYPNGDPNVIAIATSKRTTSFPTGSMVRVLGTNTFLASTDYYDEKGRHIQTTEENIKLGKDVTTLQYHWDGRLLSSHSKHTTANSGYNSFGILTKNLFDKIGRVTSVQKKYGSNAFKTIASYDFDDVGRLKTKHLSPGYTGSGKNELEGLTYSYNIHSNITGINKDYALKATGYNKWNNFFGLLLGYDKTDNVFAATRLDGRVTGLLWNTMGDDAQRKYDYTYDNAGRLTGGVFKERQTIGAVWDNSKMDFSVGGTGTGNTITYDLNGNLLSMLQKGVLPGSATAVEIDKLAYTYEIYSNKLKSVADNGTAGAKDGLFGDFKDVVNITDYVYDNNGNLVIDLNKNVKDLTGTATHGITYNFLDKPEQIKIVGKGTIKIVYDAEGNKLQKVYTPEGSSTAKTTTYINQFVYEGDKVQYINFEEGRIRIMQTVTADNGYDALSINGNMDLPDGKRGAYDYFIRDYQENVRMILTEETHFSSGQATMETARAANEEPVFGQTGANNEVVQTRFAVSSIPGQSSGGGWQNTAIGTQVSRLGSLVGKKTGPNYLQKVMAGDVLSANVQYYYKNPVTNGTGDNLTANILSALVQAITGSSSTNSVTKGAATNISSELNGTPAFKLKTAPDATNAAGTAPKAYLTVLFFDERFKFVEEGSGTLRVSQADAANASLTLASLKAPKNGYVYVYVSNESSEYVYFDNLQVSHNRGRIIEEDHYYAFGLKIAGISSTKLGDVNEGLLKNQHLYNDKELWEEADLNWYDYGFRNYDPQIGRFPQLDPLTWNYPELTNYQYAGNEPVANVDLDGLEPWNVLMPVIVTGHATKAAATVSNFTQKALKLTGSFVLGVANAWASNQVLGAGRTDAVKNGLTDRNGVAFQWAGSR